MTAFWKRFRDRPAEGEEAGPVHHGGDHQEDEEAIDAPGQEATARRGQGEAVGLADRREKPGEAQILEDQARHEPPPSGPSRPPIG